MNKGLAAATGEYVLHLNAGDRLRYIPRQELEKSLADNIDVACFAVAMEGFGIHRPDWIHSPIHQCLAPPRHVLSPRKPSRIQHPIPDLWRLRPQPANGKSRKIGQTVEHRGRGTNQPRSVAGHGHLPRTIQAWSNRTSGLHTSASPTSGVTSGPSFQPSNVGRGDELLCL